MQLIHSRWRSKKGKPRSVVPLNGKSGLRLERFSLLSTFILKKERAHRFYVVGRYNRSSGVVKPGSEARAVSAVADGVGCVRLRRADAGERAERGGAGRGGRQRSGEGRGQQRETASPMVLHCGILWERR